MSAKKKVRTSVERLPAVAVFNPMSFDSQFSKLTAHLETQDDSLKDIKGQLGAIKGQIESLAKRVGKLELKWRVAVAMVVGAGTVVSAAFNAIAWWLRSALR